MNNPLVSVIIPTKNSSRTLEKCLESIKNQSYKNIEVIVVDQESFDNTKEIALRFGAILIETPSSAFYTPPTKSRNEGVELSKGEILYHLDSDMILTPELIGEAVDKFLNRSSLGALIFHEQDLPKGFWGKAKALERKCYWGNQDIESARIVKRNIFKEVGDYDENISSGEDFDIHRRYQKITEIDFCKNVIFHDLGRLNFFRLIKKKYFYGKTAKKYFEKYSESGISLFKEQLKCFLKNYKLFMTSPLIGCGTVILKISEFGSGGVGYLMGKFIKNTIFKGTANNIVFHDINFEKHIINNPLVSVIIPTKNSSRTLEKCLESIKNQSYKNIEVIVVIPKEDTEFIKLSKKYNFNLIYCDEGKNASRNKGSKNSKGEYLLHIDDDMRLSRDVIAECINLVLKENYTAIAILETEEISSGLYNKIRVLEKTIVAFDIYVTAPRFFEKDFFNQLGNINVKLDPIDEGDLKAKLIEKGISYTTTKNYIVLSSENRMTSLKSRWFHMYKRGQKMPLFNFLHPKSNQLKPFKRIGPYIQKSELLLQSPFVGFILILIKTIDLIVLNIGALNITKEDKKLISALKNKSIFEKEAGLYQKEFFENTIGARYVDRVEKEIVEKYLKNVDKNSHIKILDLGAGGGRWSELMLNYFPNSEVFACDLSEGMVRDLGEKFKGESRFKVVVGDMQNIPFEDNYFDLVISIRAIKYASDQKKVFDEMSRILKFQGKGIIELPYMNLVYRLVKCLRIFGKISEYANRIVLSDQKKVKKVLQGVGFKIIFFDKFFTIPATLYKNCKSKIFLFLLNIINSILPKSIFGRSLFIYFKK